VNDIKDIDFILFVDIGARITKKEKGIHGRFREASHHVKE